MSNRTRKTFPVVVTYTTPQETVVGRKPLWLRKIHALGIHGEPAMGCRKCQALLIREAGK